MFKITIYRGHGHQFVPTVLVWNEYITFTQKHLLPRTRTTGLLEGNCPQIPLPASRPATRSHSGTFHRPQRPPLRAKPRWVLVARHGTPPPRRYRRSASLRQQNHAYISVYRVTNSTPPPLERRTARSPTDARTYKTQETSADPAS